MNAMAGLAVMMLQMDESPGELDQCLVEDIVLSMRTQPDVFEDIVGGIVFLRVEEPEVFEVARMESGGAIHPRHARGDALVFAHGDQAASSAA